MDAPMRVTLSDARLPLTGTDLATGSGRARATGGVEGAATGMYGGVLGPGSPVGAAALALAVNPIDA